MMIMLRFISNFILLTSTLSSGSERPLGTREVAQFKPAVQSSTYGGKKASYAVDGSDVTCSVAGVGSQSTSWAWWQVDLGSIYDVKFVQVKNTLDSYESQYLSYFDVFVGPTNSTNLNNNNNNNNNDRSSNNNNNNMCYSYQKSSHVGEEILLQCPDRSIGRFVTIKRFAGFRSDALSLCSVKVFVEGNKYQGENLESPAIKLIDVNSTLASQSKTFSTFSSNLAVDKINNTCSIAGVGSGSADYGWWMVDLGMIYNVTSITILNSMDYYESMFLNKFNVYIDIKRTESSFKCASYDETNPVSSSSSITLTCIKGGVRGRYVTIKRFGGFRQDALSLCEVYIFGIKGDNILAPQESPRLKLITPISWSQSSIYSTYSIDLAFDGSRDTCFIIGEGSSSQNFAWLTLDIGASYDVRYLDIVNHYRYYEASFMNQLEISFDSNPTNHGTSPDRKICYVINTIEPADTREELKITCADNTFGRFMTFRKLGGFRQDALSMCELQIFVVDSGPRNTSELESTTQDSIRTPPSTKVSTATTTLASTNPSVYVPTTSTKGPTTLPTSTSTLTSSTSSSSSSSSSASSLPLSTSTTATSSSSPESTTAITTTTRPLTRTMSCPDGFMKCSNSNMCIPLVNKCDKWNDCDDFSDELNCDCSLQGRFRCNNSKCIDPAFVCDKDDDCGDSSDESNCNCSVAEFKCNNGKCIKLSERCNSFDNCGDKSDEDGCGLCSANDYHCDQVNCINTLDVCNTQFDCEDGSDELNCDCGSGYRCNVTGHCIFKNQICDRIKHCPDNSDEINCTCLDFQYKCLDGPCINNNWLCDGNQDCPLGDDEEEACPKCRSNQFTCLHRRTCLEQFQVCDGVNDCPDHDDEKSCLKIGDDDNTEMVPLKLIMGGDQYYICNVLWSDIWSYLACFYLNLGTPEGTSSVNIPSTSKFVTLKSIEPDKDGQSFIDLFNRGASCPTNSAVILKCSKTSNSVCGLRSDISSNSSNNLVNADEALKGDWPWNVQVFVKNKFVCGGTLVARNWVLTASHCFDSLLEDADSTTPVFLVMGTNNLDSISIDIPRLIDNLPQNVQYSFVNRTSIKRHTNYDYLYNTFDVALIKLNSPVVWTDLVKPSCLPYSAPAIVTPFYKVCYAIGYGKTYPDSTYSKHLLQGRMNILDFDVCINDIVNKTRFYYSYVESNLKRDSMFCAGTHPSTSSTFTCRGDSGSPLMCQDMSERWVIMGISSFSFESIFSTCENSIYADVSKVMDWINNVLYNNSDRTV